MPDEILKDTRGNAVPAALDIDAILDDIADMKNTGVGLIDDIRANRNMYDLNWEPDDKRDDIEYSVDPLPVTVVDHAADRLCAQRPLLDVPVSQFSIDEQTLSRDEELMRYTLLEEQTPDLAMKMGFKEGYQRLLSRKQTSFAREKSDKLEKYLIGILEWNERERNENIVHRLAQDLLSDGVGTAKIVWDFDAAEGDCPIPVHRVDPVASYWRMGLHGLDAFVAVDTLGYTADDILEQYGLDVRESKDDPWSTKVEFQDYWRRVKVKSGKKRHKYEIWHAMLTGGKLEGGKYSGGQCVWGPEKTDYTTIPYVVSEPRPYEDAEDTRRRRSVLTGLKKIWEEMNRTNTRWSVILKKAAFQDIMSQGTAEQIPVEKIGKGESARFHVTSETAKVAFIQSPDAPGSIHMYRQMLDQQAQLATFPKPTLGDRGGTTSGIQDVTLIQSGLVRLNAYVRALELLLEGIFDQIQLRTLEFGKDKDVWTIQTGDSCQQVKLGDIKGRHKLHVKIKGETPVEELMRGLAFLQYRVGPTPLLSDDYILDKGLGIQYPGEEQEKSLRQAVERHQTLIDFNAEMVRAQLETQTKMQAKIQEYMLQKQSEMFPQIAEMEMKKAMMQLAIQKMMMQGMGPPPGAPPGAGPGNTMGGQSGPAAMPPEAPDVANRLAAMGLVPG